MSELRYKSEEMLRKEGLLIDWKDPFENKTKFKLLIPGKGFGERKSVKFIPIKYKIGKKKVLLLHKDDNYFIAHELLTPEEKRKCVLETEEFVNTYPMFFEPA